MSIKFPDFQVLVSRSEQIPRITRERDETGAAGKMAPQVAQEFTQRQKRIDETEAKEKIRERKKQKEQTNEQEAQQKQKKKGQQKNRRGRIDLRA